MIIRKLLLYIDDIKKVYKILDRNVCKMLLVKFFYLISKMGGEIYLKLENM